MHFFRVRCKIAQACFDIYAGKYQPQRNVDSMSHSAHRLWWSSLSAAACPVLSYTLWKYECNWAYKAARVPTLQRMSSQCLCMWRPIMWVIYCIYIIYTVYCQLCDLCTMFWFKCNSPDVDITTQPRGAEAGRRHTASHLATGQHWVLQESNTLGHSQTTLRIPEQGIKGVR